MEAARPPGKELLIHASLDITPGHPRYFTDKCLGNRAEAIVGLEHLPTKSKALSSTPTATEGREGKPEV